MCAMNRLMKFEIILYVIKRIFIDHSLHLTRRQETLKRNLLTEYPTVIVKDKTPQTTPEKSPEKISSIYTSLKK